jgi:hypothetical protein
MDGVHDSAPSALTFLQKGIHWRVSCQQLVMID